MVRIVAIGGTAAVLALAAAAVAAASGGGPGFTRLGPYVGSNIPVAGSCGNTYLVISRIDTRYRVFPREPDGSYVVEQVANANGLTQAGSSPQACTASTGATVAAGIRVSSHGDALFVIHGGSFNPKASCSSPCFFAQFVPSFFGPTANGTLVSAVELQTTSCNGSVIDNGFGGGTVAGDITGTRNDC